MKPAFICLIGVACLLIAFGVWAYSYLEDAGKAFAALVNV